MACTYRIFHIKKTAYSERSKKEYWETLLAFLGLGWTTYAPMVRFCTIHLLQVSESAVKGGKLYSANSMIISNFRLTFGEPCSNWGALSRHKRFTNLTLKADLPNGFIDKFLFYYGFKRATLVPKELRTKSSFASVDMVDSEVSNPNPVPQRLLDDP